MNARSDVARRDGTTVVLPPRNLMSEVCALASTFGGPTVECVDVLRNWELARSGDSSALDAQIETAISRHTSVSTRALAVRAIVELRSDYSHDEIVAALRRVFYSVRCTEQESTRVLGRMTPAKWRKLRRRKRIERAQKNASRIVGRAVRAEVIGGFRLIGAVDELAAMLPLSDTRDTIVIAEALAEFGLGSAEALATAMAHATERRAAARLGELLVRLGTAVEAHWIAILSTGRSAYCRAFAARQLGRMGTERALTALKAAVSDNAAVVRSAVLDALGSYTDDATVRLLVHSLVSESKKRVRSAARRGLVMVGAAAMPMLLKSSDAPRRQARSELIDTVIAIGKSASAIAGASPEIPSSSRSDGQTKHEYEPLLQIATAALTQFPNSWVQVDDLRNLRREQLAVFTSALVTGLAFTVVQRHRRYR